MQQIREEVAAYAAAFDPALMPAPLAQKILEDAIATENMLSTIKALAAKRVADTELWRREGHLSPAHHLARKAGTSVTRAKEALETAARLSQLPALDAAARAGEVSGSQAGPVAEAAAKNPRAELRLVRMAKRGSLGELLDECARTKAAAEPDADARHRAIHASRHLRRRRTADGAGELTYRSTLDEVGELFSIVQGYAQRVFEKARAAGRREPEEAYLADGLLAAARAGAASGRARPGRGTGTGAGGAYGAGRGAAGPGRTVPDRAGRGRRLRQRAGLALAHRTLRDVGGSRTRAWIPHEAPATTLAPENVVESNRLAAASAPVRSRPAAAGLAAPTTSHCRRRCGRPRSWYVSTGTV